MPDGHIYDGEAFALPDISFSDFDLRLAYLEFLGPLLLQLLDNLVRSHREVADTPEFRQAVEHMLGDYVDVAIQALERAS